jgi:hypothetical protein
MIKAVCSARVGTLEHLAILNIASTAASRNARRRENRLTRPSAHAAKIEVWLPDSQRVPSIVNDIALNAMRQYV